MNTYGGPLKIMAKDDYDVIAYRVLVYLYACMKRKILFEDVTFQAAVRKNVESDEYFASILRMMQDEGYIRGLMFTDAWGGDFILASDIRNARITAAGIHYLQENSKMKKVGEALKESVDIISKLAQIVAIA